MTLLLMMALIFGAMYFLMIRPQQRRRREAETMQRTLGPGDEVVTIGGLYGTVVEVDDETVTLLVAEDVENRYARGAIAKVTSKADTPAETDGAKESDASVAAGKPTGKDAKD